MALPRPAQSLGGHRKQKRRPTASGATADGLGVAGVRRKATRPVLSSSDARGKGMTHPPPTPALGWPQVTQVVTAVRRDDSDRRGQVAEGREE